MKYLILVSCLCILLPLAANASFFDDDTSSPCINASGATFEAMFSAPGALSPAIVRELEMAKKSIRVAAHDFTSKPVSETLLKAARNGVDVKIVLNKKTNESVYSAAQFLLTMSHPAHLTKSDDALHADYIVVDGRDVILGSVAAFADAEEEKKNSAAVLIIRTAPDLAKQYLAHWQSLWDASEEMKPGKD